MFGSSQGFGYAAPTQAAPQKARQEDKQTCLPVTVRILQDAVARHAQSQEVMIHGTEASIVHLVGVVEGLVQQAAMIEFQLNDASGRMKVRYYVQSDSVKGLPELTAGSYVSVVGNLRTSPAAHVSAMSLQPVKSAEEVSYHMIEVAHAALRLQNPTKAAAQRTSTAMADPITPAKQGLGLGLSAPSNNLSPAKEEAPVPAHAPANVEMPQPVQTPPKAAVDLRTAVIDILKRDQEAGSAEGISLSSLVSGLGPAQQASAEKVKSVLAQLVDEGDVFTTIDDDHFQML